MKIHSFFLKVHNKSEYLIRKATAISNSCKNVNSCSYFPELTRKPLSTRKMELLNWARKFGEINEFYNLYGFDIIDFRNSEDYIDYYSFMASRDRINRIFDFWSYISLLRDKFLFYKYISSNNLPTAEVFATIRNGIVYDTMMEEISWKDLKDKTDYFIKEIEGECASFVKHMNNFEDLIAIRENLNKGNYILQRKITQSKIMDKINPYSINTLRVVTINKNGEPYVLSSLLRVGTRKTGCVDNWAVGGLAIGIQDNGFCKEFGFYKPGYGTKTNKHPDNDIIFSQFLIPNYLDALNLAITAHKFFYGIRAIGWDIAITENGPILIEGNDNFEISLQQACDRPLKKEWIEVCA